MNYGGYIDSIISVITSQKRDPITGLTTFGLFNLFLMRNVHSATEQRIELLVILLIPIFVRSLVENF